MTLESTTLGSSTISALDLAGELGMDRPTDEQQRVIEAPLEPSLVIAGAGSGKTATMANRVIWLLANGHVRVPEILGLTFTRKAAGELNARITGYIDSLRLAGLLPAPSAPVERGDGSSDPGDLFDRPTVSTYNSFGNTIFRDNALLVGREPESVLLGENAAWGLARRVVLERGDERLVPLRKNLEQLVDAVLSLSHELSENVVDPRAVEAIVRDFGYLTALPYTEGRAKATPYASVGSAMEQVTALPVLIELAEQYARQKKAKGLVEFSDQVALALAICSRHPTVIDEYRSRFRVVLLDEYQDTSVVQTRLLCGLFGGHGVMAVGDPHQSIYGWRGASASNLAWFGRDFAGTDDVPTYSLSTSWRNARRVLDAANTLVEPLRLASPVEVQPLRARPDAPEGSVDARFLETRDDEAETVAAWIEERLAEPRPAGAKPVSAAMLFRVRSHMEFFAAALERRGIPHHILGVGGLLNAPEVVDVLSALRATYDPSAGSSLLRLLSGARWRIGVRDLRGLSEVASLLAAADSFHRPVSGAVKQSMRESVAPDDGASVVDALDFVAEAAHSHPWLARFSADGLARLRHAGRTVATFRSRGGLPLLDFVRFIEQELLLDIELAANERTVDARSGRPQSSLDALHDEISSFLAGDDEGTLGSFLSWLDRAEKRDDLSPRSDEPEPGTVQLLTIHGAKGLEWDVVAIPRLVADEIPAQSKEGKGWLRFGVLPYEFRGDAAELPQLGWRGLSSQQAFDDNVKSFSAELAAKHLAEERRLIYVAATRARSSLLLTGSFWATQSRPRGSSTFLRELSSVELIDEPPEAPEDDENPLDSGGLTESWPLDPLGTRRPEVERAADAVRVRMEGEPLSAGRWQRDLDLLLLERDRERAAAGTAPIPHRIAASRFKDFVTDPQAVARALRRPMPERPFRQTRLGTRFHSWVESRYGIGAASELIDTMPGEQDADATELPLEEVELARLQGIFESSEWASRKPVEVEVEIHLVLGGHVLVCKIDAIFRDGDRYQVVDWKTGKAPKDAADLEVKQLQLALYRLAYARWRGIDPESIDAVFYYVSDDTVIDPERLFSEQELLDLWPF